ncbi:thioredoxin family protein [Paenarthrobacter nitroguajacolicus]
MRIELLHVDECPNSARAYERLETALTGLGRTDLAVHQRRLTSESDIRDTGFAGSPTITVNGVDIFPTGSARSDWACRIHMTPDGHSGLPTLDRLTEALRNHGL